jgi:hypothetical protein
MRKEALGTQESARKNKPAWENEKRARAHIKDNKLILAGTNHFVSSSSESLWLPLFEFDLFCNYFLLRNNKFQRPASQRARAVFPRFVVATAPEKITLF